VIRAGPRRQIEQAIGAELAALQVGFSSEKPDRENCPPFRQERQPQTETDIGKKNLAISGI
jgi:hypothetical protein